MTSKMTKAQALAVARRKWGQKAIVDDRGRKHGPSSPAQRAKASLLLAEHRAAKPVMLPLDEWDGNALVGEYRRALAAHNDAYRAWREKESLLLSDAMYYRFQVGADTGWAFHIHGSGDSWEGALAKAGFSHEMIVEGQKRKATR